MGTSRAGARVHVVLRRSTSRAPAGPSAPGCPCDRRAGPLAPCLAQALYHCPSTTTPGPPPPGAVRLWTDVVRAPSTAAGPPRPVAPGPVSGPEFSVPFNPSGMELAPRELVPVEPVEVCFLEAPEDIWRMEEELTRDVLTRDVLVTVTGTRPAVDMASAATALHAEFGVGTEAMSIRAFYPEDFLVLCHDGAVRERMVRAGRVTASWFELKLHPWFL
ncbi:hypothetical protein ZWY2020_040722 [Hordeum vulgare]|nr:hypothetical protein ZWY2020_040722 [Hordeum vulgare]